MDNQIFGTCKSDQQDKEGASKYLCATQQTWESMAKVYVNASIELLNSTKEENQVPHIVFLCRHSLELTMKYGLTRNIEASDQHSVEYKKELKEIIKVQHNLLELVADLAFDTDFFNYVSLDLVFEFHREDPNSFTYRYPTDTKGNNSCEHGCCINTENLLNLMNELSSYLEDELIEEVL